MIATTRQRDAAPRSGLGMCQLLLGVLVGLIAGYGLWNDPAQEQTVLSRERSVPAGTSVVYVNVTLLDPTTTITPIPTVKPTTAPAVDIRINDCGTATPGAVCLYPPLPTATTTPYVACDNATPGELCQWR